MSLGYFVTGRGSSVLRGILTLLLGASLLCWPGFTSALIVKLIAGFLLALGVITLLTAVSAASRTKSPVPALVAINVGVYLVFGLLVFLFPSFFLGLIAFLFGAVLLVAGVSQLSGLWQARQVAHVAPALYILPVAITVCGITMFFSPGRSTQVLTMIFGAAVLLYGISELVSVWKLRKSLQKTGYTDFEEV